MSALLPTRYRAVRHLSETLYGSVFLCDDLQVTASASLPSCTLSDRRVVLKQIEILHAMRLLNAQDGTAQSVDDPRQEKAVSNLLRRTGGHTNIVQYLDDLIEDKMLYFVMEYCADGDLYDFVHRDNETPPTMEPLDALSVIAQVSAGVHFLHYHNIAHRDLSLENILLHKGICKITDFGLSTRCENGQKCSERVGKAYYMAPEVVAAGENYDPRAADMWSLGIILFILLTGSPLVPIASRESKAFMAFKRAGVRAVLESWRVAPSLSMELIDLLVGLLQVEPAKRLTVDQVRDHRCFVSWTAYSPRNEASPSGSEAAAFINVTPAPEQEMMLQA